MLYWYVRKYFFLTHAFSFAFYRHVDLYYEDGGNPSEEILQAFLQLCETERGAIAVHCKAGLGRTGTNIAAYMMKHYGYTARETMAWCRYGIYICDDFKTCAKLGLQDLDVISPSFQV